MARKTRLTPEARREADAVIKAYFDGLAGAPDPRWVELIKNWK